jgi:FtsP/CotA-like multicopper oxidase with cupredoxin domain
MKSKFYSKLFIPVFSFLLLAVNLFSQAPPVTSVGPAVLAGGTYTVPVTVTGFVNVANISMKLNYDASKLIYTGITPNSGLITTRTITTPVSDQSGSVRLSYASASAIVMGNPVNTLVTITFTVKPGVESGVTPLSWSTVQGDCDMAPPLPAVFSPQITPDNLSTYFIGNIIDIVRPVPTITGPQEGGLPATLGSGVTTGQVYFTEAGMSNYQWTVTPAGSITDGAGTNSITVTWTNPTGQQAVSVNYEDANGISAAVPTVLIINYYPFPVALDPAVVLQFVDPLPHFAAGLRVNAKAGGNLLIKQVPVQQVALSKGTPLSTGIVGSAPGIGLGKYAAYAISTDNGNTFGPAMWPAQTIEAQVGHPLTVQYRNDMFGLTYDDFNVLADQTLLFSGYPQNGDPYVEPYRGPIPMVVHLHGGEIPSNSDGGPTAWFMPGYSLLGPGFQHNASSLASYPNMQEAGTLWYHPHDQGLTRINPWLGLAGFYFLRGTDEETSKLPGWSGDDKVMEQQPIGKNPPFNGENTYLPEIEIAIQDRMFNTEGELYWPVDPPNPEIHPFWSPEFFGDIITVNGKSWPYLSVAPRKYRFRILDGSNARFYNMWLRDTITNVPAPAITVVGSDGGFLDIPAVLDPALGQALTIGPGERYDVIIDFSDVPPNTMFTLMNNANAPFPDGDPVLPGFTDRIMQFVVNGTMVSASGSGTGTDKSDIPANVRPLNPMIKLTDFEGSLAAGVVPDVKRQIILNEVSGAGGPVQALFNNSHFDTDTPILGAPLEFGGPTEFPLEGTTELVSIINTTVDAHPIHIHLTQWQLVSRQLFNTTGFAAAYAAAWAPRGVPEFPAGQGYPGGGGSPYPYDTLNSDGAVGGNPAISPYLMGLPIPADPQERVWKDDIRSIPGEVATYIVRYAPTDRPINAPVAQLLYPFDPSEGPGYVWHCHIIDHEDMDMMRPLIIRPSALRYPQITGQPASVLACVGDIVTYSVTATSATTISYIWQVSTNGGSTWTDLTNSGPYTGVTTSTLRIAPATLSLTTNLYHCVLTNIDGVVTTNAALLTVNECNISGTLKYNNSVLDPLVGMTVSVNGRTSTTNALGEYLITGVTSGTHAVNVNNNGKLPGGINSTDAGGVNYWFVNPVPIPNVKFLAGDVNKDQAITAADGLSIQRYFVLDQQFAQSPWVFWNAIGSGNTNPPAFTVAVNGASVPGLNILAMCAGDFNGSFLPGISKGEARSSVEVITGDIRKAAENEEFELALRAGSKLQVGAVSLILNIPSNLVDVTGASLKGSNIPVTFNQVGNELRIGWNALSPVSVQPEEELVILKLRSTSSFTKGTSVQVSMNYNPLNELADGNFEVIEKAVLKSDVIEASSVKGENLGDKLLLTNYPNPATGYTTIYYTVPVNGKVTLDIYNSLGESVSTLANENKSAGKYSVRLDASSMPQGVYMATLRLRSNNADMVRTIKFIVSK